MATSTLTSPDIPSQTYQAAGLGLRFPHYDDLLASTPPLGFIEVHTENLFGGGYHLNMLEQAAQYYPVSMHCVGLSLGSSEPLDAQHLANVKALVERFNPMVVSDHASWSRSGNVHLGDLLPLPYTEETLGYLCDNVKRVQDTLGRQILVENPSTYLQFTESTMRESLFMRKVAEKTGCGLLLDLNNICVQAHNNGVDIEIYFEDVAGLPVGEIHLAGHIEQECGDETLLIDTHSKPVCDTVWELYRSALKRFGAIPTLIEWDKDIPAFEVVLSEVEKASGLLQDNQSEARCYGVG